MPDLKEYQVELSELTKEDGIRPPTKLEYLARKEELNRLIQAAQAGIPPVNDNSSISLTPILFDLQIKYINALILGDIDSMEKIAKEYKSNPGK